MISQILIATLTLAFGAAGLWIAARLRRDAAKSRDWPTVAGKIVERGVERMQSDARSFTPAVRYSYTIAGKDYVGQQVYRTGRVGRMQAAAERLGERLHDPIPVHYN